MPPQSTTVETCSIREPPDDALLVGATWYEHADVTLAAGHARGVHSIADRATVLSGVVIEGDGTIYIEPR